MTQAQLGEMIGVKRSEISKLERGSRNMTIATVLKIFRALQADMEILSDIENSKVRPSKKLLKEVSSNIKDKLKGDLKIFSSAKTKSDYILLDEQLVVYDTVMSIIKKGLADKQKYAIIVKGGAGTGKSVIAIQLLADLAAVGKNAHYATGSKSFTQTLRKIVGSNSSSIFKYFMSYGFVDPNSLDVLIMDEAHRIREKTGFPHKSTGREQVVDLMRAAKVSVFFIDDYQGVRAGEIGQSDYIRDRTVGRPSGKIPRHPGQKIQRELHQTGQANLPGTPDPWHQRMLRLFYGQGN